MQSNLYQFKKDHKRWLLTNNEILIFLHKISVLIEFCILPMSWQYESEARPPSSFFNFWHPYRAKVKKWQGLISRLYNVKEAIKIMRKMAALLTENYNKELSNNILVQKGENLSRNKRQRNDVAHPFLSNFVIHLDEEKRKVRSKVKKTGRKGSPSSSLSSLSSHSSSSESEKKYQVTKIIHNVSNEDQFK